MICWVDNKQVKPSLSKSLSVDTYIEQVGPIFKKIQAIKFLKIYFGGVR